VEAPVHRYRIGGLLTVAGCAVVLLALAPRPEDRVPWLTLVALPLGYGHLLGALLLARRRVPLRRSVVLFTTVSTLTALALYSWALSRAEWLLYPMFAVSAWHIFENDIALAQAQRRRTSVPPIPRAPGVHGAALVLSAVLALATLATPIGSLHAMRQLGWRPASLPISAVDLVAAVLMYHAISWLWFLFERTRQLPRSMAKRARARLLWIHLGPLTANAVLYATFPSAHQIVAAPSLYLFWSFLHALETAWRRGLAASIPHQGESPCRSRSSR
jgi:hypothetical protein